MQLANQLRAAGIPCFPCRADKSPAVARGDSWRRWASEPVTAQHWPSALVGVPVPDNLVILDLDSYKGVTRTAVEAVTGPLQWDAALIQGTPGGGEHYAFRAPAWPVRQGSNLHASHIGQGFDTRVAGKGFIATGHGYAPHGAGVYRLAAPQSLPALPDTARAALEHVTAAPPPPGTPAREHGETDPDTVRDALRHIDPSCARSEWIRVCMALRAGFADDEATAHQLAEEWSAGQLWGNGEDIPHNYVPDGPGSVSQQLYSLKPDGDTRLGSLFYMAVQGGWAPPARAMVDTAAAFGAGAADSDTFSDLVERVQAEGGNPVYMDSLALEIAELPCSDVQRAILRALLTREAKEAGLGTKSVRQAIDPPSGSAQAGYGKGHTINAQLFLSECYPDGTLVRADQTYYEYTGKVWRPLTDDGLEARVARALAPSQPQSSTVSGTVAQIGRFAHSETSAPTANFPGTACFENGVLHFDSGMLTPHDKGYRATCLLPYDYQPGAQCPHWLQFLSTAFSGDSERIALLQEWFGYLLSGDNAHHKTLLLIGPPRSGKGTIGRMLSRLVGEDNYAGGSLSDFASPPTLDLLRHKTVMFIGDAQRNLPGNIRDAIIERVKQITGGDEITFSRKYKGSVTAVLPTRITVAANSLPRMFDDSGALAGRIMPLPLDVSHAGREDLRLLDVLVGELEGVAAWALKGLARLRAQGRFTLPAASQDESDYIRESYSPLSVFLDACAHYSPEATVSSREVYDCYLKWCQSTGEDTRLSQRAVTSAVKDHAAAHGAKYRAAVRVDGEVVRGFIGMRLTPPTAQAFQSGEVVPFR